MSVLCCQEILSACLNTVTNTVHSNALTYNTVCAYNVSSMCRMLDFNWQLLCFHLFSLVGNVSGRLSAGERGSAVSPQCCYLWICACASLRGVIITIREAAHPL